MERSVPGSAALKRVQRGGIRKKGCCQGCGEVGERGPEGTGPTSRYPTWPRTPPASLRSSFGSPSLHQPEHFTGSLAGTAAWSSRAIMREDAGKKKKKSYVITCQEGRDAMKKTLQTSEERGAGQQGTIGVDDEGVC